MRELGSLTGEIEFRGIVQWPRQLHDWNERRTGPFGKATFDSTLRLLKHELRQIDATNVRIQMALDDNRIRVDGIPRADARPTHPGVILSFDKAGVGRLTYPCDKFHTWHHNLRAIALTLEALRRPERYEVLVAGEQYSGSRMLTAGGVTTTMTAKVAAEFMATHGMESVNGAKALLSEPSLTELVYKQAAKKLHPDNGGTADQLDLLTKARDTLRAHHGL